jgi:hypothetical protein
MGTVVDVAMALPVGSVYNAWALTGADKASAVATNDGDTTRLTGTINQRQTLNTFKPAASAIISVKHKMTARMSVAGPNNLNGECWTADETTGSAQVAVSGFVASYTEQTSAACNNPYSGDANWTVADFNNMVATVVMPVNFTCFLTKWVLELDYTPAGGGWYIFGLGSWLPPLVAASNLFGSCLSAEIDLLYVYVSKLLENKVGNWPSKDLLPDVLHKLQRRPVYCL